MTSPLQQQLSQRSVGLEKLVQSGIPDERAGALLSGADPTISEVRKISRTFNIPIRSLIAGISKQSVAGYKLRENYRTAGEPDLEIFDLISTAEVLANVLPENGDRRISFAVTFEHKTFDFAEELASFCRAEILNVDFRAPLIDLDSHLSIRTNVRSLVIDQPHLEGSLVSHHDHLFIFLSTRPDPRMRFTLAHEFCHYLCDVSTSGNSAWFDEDIFDPAGSERRDELFANAFASALLLPPNGVGDALKAFRNAYRFAGNDISDVEIILLARFFGVSFQVAARRLEDLKLLPAGAGQSLYQAVRKKFGSPEQLAKQLGLPPRAEYDWAECNFRVIREASAAIAAGELSIGRLSEMVNIPIPQLLDVIRG
jgi:Zn-dependent peptidase ImmA (M78 family)